MLHGLIALARNVNRQLFRLLALQIENVKISPIFEDDGIGSEARPHHVELVELRKLLDLLASNVIAVQVQLVLRSPVGAEINGVVMPHRERVRSSPCEAILHLRCSWNRRLIWLAPGHRYSASKCENC